MMDRKYWAKLYLEDPLTKEEMERSGMVCYDEVGYLSDFMPHFWAGQGYFENGGGI